MVCQSFLLFFSPGVLVQLHKYEAVKMSDGPPFIYFSLGFGKKYIILLFLTWEIAITQNPLLMWL